MVTNNWLMKLRTIYSCVILTYQSQLTVTTCYCVYHFTTLMLIILQSLFDKSFMALMLIVQCAIYYLYNANTRHSK